MGIRRDSHLISGQSCPTNGVHLSLSGPATGLFLFFSTDTTIYNNNFANNGIHIQDLASGGNLFNLPLPDGGNWYDSFDVPGEGCIDTGPDKNGFCDSFFFFPGGQDELPSLTLFDLIPNQPPECDDLAVVLTEDTPGNAVLPCSDPDAGDTIDIEILSLSLIGVSGPALGLVSGPITITPDLNHDTSGGTFTYQATDSSSAVSIIRTATISVTPVNDAPVCTDVTATITEDVSGSVSVPCSDPDIGDIIAVEIVSLSLTGVSGPILGPVTGPVPLNPDLNHEGSGGSFTCQATDTSSAISNIGTATISVTPVNDAPVCSDMSVTLIEDTPDVAVLPCSDVDTSDTIAIEIVSLSLTGVSGPIAGTVGGSVPLNPDLNHNGSGGSFTYFATDIIGAVSGTSTASIDVTATITEDISGSVSLNCTDVDAGDTIAI